MKKQTGNVLILVVATVAVVLVGGFLLLNRQKSPESGLTDVSSPGSTSDSDETAIDKAKFTTPKKSAHFETSTPEHGAILAGVPVSVVIDFNFDLGAGSTISINQNSRDFGVGEAEIGTNKLSMRKKLDQSAPDGVYTVEYKACWPDGSCHDGHFQFAIVRTQAANFTDMLGKKQVTVKLTNTAFDQVNIRISRGTTVTWVNNDTVEHFINTDSHPAHTYYPSQNSRGLSQGDTYKVTFDSPGFYPYHCSAHASNMIAAILVE